MAVEIAEDKAASVEEYDQWQRGGRGGSIEAKRNWSFTADDEVIANQG